MMNRRKFLQISGVSLVGVLVPVIGNAKPIAYDGDPKTVDELIAAMENRFDCRMGYPGPYVFKANHHESQTVPDKYRYITYGLQTGADYAQAEERLVQSLWATFRQYPEGARMYWRLDYKINIESSDVYASDGWTPTGEKMKRIRTRVAFPENYKG
jgi:hypothetical protein